MNCNKFIFNYLIFIYNFMIYLYEHYKQLFLKEEKMYGTFLYYITY